MHKIKYFLTPIDNKNITNINDFETYILGYCDLIDYVMEKEDEVIIPKEYYDTFILNGINICDYLYSDDYASDFRDFLFDHIKELTMDDIGYSDIFSNINNNSHDDYL